MLTKRACPMYFCVPRDNYILKHIICYFNIQNGEEYHKAADYFLHQIAGFICNNTSELFIWRNVNIHIAMQFLRI